MSKISSRMLFIIIFLGAAFFRFYGVNWDQDQHLHPDERFLTMVTGAISWPNNIYEYLDTNHSPLNPQNRGFGFFVYGTFPVFLTKYAAEILNQADYNGITLVGRKLSALFDLGTVILVFLITKKLTTKDKRPTTNGYLPHLTMFLYATLVTPIQLSHFYAVDTYLVFFLTLSFYFLIKILNSKFLIQNSLLLGISLGLAASSKISAVLFLPVAGLGIIILFFKKRFSLQILYYSLVIVFISVLTFRFFQPYAFQNPAILNFKINANFIESLKTLKSFDGPQTSFPPALQWIPTIPYLYPLIHLSIWGVGIPFSVLTLASFYFAFKFKLKYKNLPLLLLILWIILLFAYQAGQFAKALRYLAPILPFLALLVAFNLILKKKLFLITAAVVVLIYPLSFLAIYNKPHSRVIASNWIYENIPAGSKLAVEHWDDGLPLTLDSVRNNGLYTFISLPLYNPDESAKWNEIVPLLNQSDYIVITSNRLWRSLSAIPKRFPQTAKYYRSLFDGRLGFKQIAVFSSYPCLIPRKTDLNNVNMEKTDLTPPALLLTQTPHCLLALNDDGAEESFTVYDHPKVIIFQKTSGFSPSKFMAEIKSP